MRRSVLVPMVLAACAGAPPVESPDAMPFAAALLQREERASSPREPASPAPRPPARRGERAEIRGLIAVSPERIAALRAADLDSLLAEPLGRDDLAALAWLRAPVVKAAHARLEAARTGFAQSADLRQLSAVYRSFARDSQRRVGPSVTHAVAPPPSVDTLSAEIVATTVAIGFEELRKTVRDIVAAAETAHADAARWSAARRILAEDVALHRSLVAVVRARFESGRTSQAGLLAFQARLESLQTELKVLDQKESVIRAEWNRLLSRPDERSVNLAVPPAPAAPPPAEGTAVARALAEREEYRAAELAVKRAALAVRLAETMTLPRLDVGSSRLEGGQFPEPGRAAMPRADFGVREAQVAEMRARVVALSEARDALRDKVRTEVREALFVVDAAARRWTVRQGEIVPLAERSFKASRGAYEGNRTGYIELLDSARRLLQARLALVDAMRDHAHARARLLRAVGAREEG